MCGIAGWVAAQSRPMEVDLPDRMLRPIIHRGPDDQGEYRFDRGFIGMRRLSIIDLEHGQQPFASADGNVQVVQNGEIYNYLELRKELERFGHRFTSESDTESILHAYRQWGLDCFSRLRGMFGIAIWDQAAQRLTLARDPMGKKPLYYTVRDGVLVFGSELKSLIEAPGIPRDIDQQAVSDYLLYGYVPHPASIFSGIHKLPPGHFLNWANGEVTIHRYWQLDFEPKLTASDAELQEELAEILDDAVRLRLASDVPWGACLSGGVDSSITVALMARHVSQPVKTFSIGFSEAEFSELDAARAVAEHVGTDHHELVVEPDAAELMEDLIWHLDEPFADSSAIPTYLVSKMAASHVKMVLTGDGGDESFGGYTRYTRFLQLQKLRRLGSAGAGGLKLVGHLLPGALGQRARGIGSRLQLPFPENYIAQVAIASRDRVDQIMMSGRADYGRLSRHFPKPGPGSPLDAIIAGDMLSYLTDDICVKVDRMSMANSLEARCPLLDSEVVRFAARLPQRLKNDGVTGKRILKSVASSLVPQEILDRPKQGFAIPLAQWLRGPLHEMTADLLGSQRFAERGLFDRSVVHTMMTDHKAGRADWSEEIWSLLCFEHWARQFADPPSGYAADPHRPGNVQPAAVQTATNPS